MRVSFGRAQLRRATARTALQEIVAVVGRSKGVVLMCPPTDSTEARTALAALTSGIKPGTKVVVAESFGGKVGRGPTGSPVVQHAPLPSACGLLL